MAQSARTNPDQLNQAGPRSVRSAGRSDAHAREWLFTLSLVLVALLPRLYVAIAWAQEPVWDGHYYHFGATRIAQGLGYSEDVLLDGVSTWKPWSHYPVGYSAFLGLLYKVFGTSLVVAPVANAVVGALTVGVVHRLAVLALSVVRARVAAVLCAIHPGLILYTALVMTEPLSALGMGLGVLLALWYRNNWGAVLSGLALGLSALVRPTALLTVPFLLFAFKKTKTSTLGSWAKLRRPLLCTALAGLCALAAIAPWTIRNCRTMDGCALISTNGGWNLAIGALTNTGRFTTLTAKDGCPVVTGQVQQDRCWAEVGRDTILKDPVAWLQLVPKKLAHTYNHESFAVGYLAEADPQRWSPSRQNRARSTLTLFHHLLMLAATFSVVCWIAPRRTPKDYKPNSTERWTPAQLALGLGLIGFTIFALGHPEHPLFWLIVVAPLLAWVRLPGAPPTGPTLDLLWGLVFMTSLTHAIFFGDDRYHITISPFLCVLAAGALRGPAGSAAESKEIVPSITSKTSHASAP